MSTKTKSILRPGLLLRRSAKKNLILAKIDSKGSVDPELKAELERMLGELGWPSMEKTIKRHKNGLLVYGGASFALLKEESRLETLLKRHQLDIKPDDLAMVLGIPRTRKRKRTSRG